MSSFYTRKYFQLAFFLGLFLGQFALSAQSSIQGQVVGATGSPLVGANVYVPALARGAATDKTGSFLIEGLPDGEHLVTFSYLGYRSLTMPLTAGTPALRIALDEDPVFTGEVIVAATRADERTPMTYATLNREELSTNNLGQDVPYLLRWTPSAVVTSDAGTGIGYTGIWIRGSDPTRINVTINGIPLNDAESQAVFWVNMPDFASSVEDVQIQRGVGSSTNGAGAFGASINLNTNKVFQEPYASSDVTVGSFNTLKGNLSFGTGLLAGGFTMDGRLSRITTDGYIDRASADMSSWYLSPAWIGKRSTVRLNVFSGQEVTYQAWNGVDAALVKDPATRTTNTAGTEKPGDPYDNEVDDYQQTHAQLLFNHQFSPQWHLNLAGHYTRGFGFFEQYKADQALAQYGIPYPIVGTDTVFRTDLIRRRWLDNDFYGSTFSLHHQNTDGKWRSTLGGGYNIYAGLHFGEVIWAQWAGGSNIRDRYYDNDATKRDFNIFYKTNYALTDAWDAYLDVQWRAVSYQFEGIENDGSIVDQTASLDFFNPKLGIQYRPQADTRAYASLAVAHREPNRNDFVGSTPANRPRPEQLYNIEAGWERQWRQATVQANLYYMYYIDQLVLNGQLDDVGAALRTNVDQSYRLGLEVVAGGNITRQLSLQGNATLSRNKIIAFTEYIDEYDADFNWLGQQPVLREDVDLAFSPNLLAAAELRYDLLPNAQRHQLSVALRGKYIGRRYLDNSADDNNSLAAYFFSDWQLQYRLAPRWGKAVRINLQVLNWLDTWYESNGWSYRYILEGQQQLQRGLYPQAGRHLLLGVGVDL